ncbi:MAG TPA: hypothetical protein VFG10_07560 [Saprospiraceae bacterium]|nr:hypothetical protein [Saprospiraceae bacterium]
MKSLKLNLIPGISILVLTLTFVPFVLSAQKSTTLKPKIYEHVFKAEDSVRVQTIEKGKVMETHIASSADVQVRPNSKSIITYEKKISVIDAALYSKIKLIPLMSGPREGYKVIPELHIETGSPGTEAFRIVFSLLQPFRYSNEVKKFKATLGFFLMPETGTSTANVLQPVDIEIVSSEVSSILPRHLQIPHLNLPSSTVDLMADHVSDSAQVKVITTSNPGGYVTYLKVEPTLEILTNVTTLQGYGIQKIPVDVRFLGLNSSGSATVNFTAGKGTVSPNSVVVSYNKPSTVYLSSEGTGEVKLTAYTNNLQSNDLNFKYVFPWAFLLSSVLGGLIGGLVKYYFNTRKRKFPIKPILGGILVGFIVAVAYYFLGINLAGLSISAGLNEIAVLGLSALGAYFGISTNPNPKPQS